MCVPRVCSGCEEPRNESGRSCREEDVGCPTDRPTDGVKPFRQPPSPHAQRVTTRPCLRSSGQTGPARQPVYDAPPSSGPVSRVGGAGGAPPRGGGDPGGCWAGRSARRQRSCLGATCFNGAFAALPSPPPHGAGWTSLLELAPLCQSAEAPLEPEVAVSPFTGL
jgi:hypothetical protein